MPWFMRTLVSSFTLYVVLWLSIFNLAYAADSGSTDDPSPNHLICKPFGKCEPCPADALNQPFCKPFGNRRLMHCVNETTFSSHTQTPGTHAPSTLLDHDPNQPHPQGETPAWESCGRIVDQERADFFEFVGCNVFFAGVAILIVLWRSKRMHALQTRQLAARIGRIRGSNSMRRLVS